MRSRERQAQRPSLIAALALLVLCGAASAQEQPSAPTRTKSRAVSMRVLQAALRAAGRRPTRTLLELCGLTRIEGYVVDRKARDLVVFGTVDPEAPPLHTEDFVVALRSASQKYVYRKGNRVYLTDPGCSIDPSPSVLRRLHGLTSRMPSGASNEEVDEVMRQWCAIAKEPQKVRVEGIPFHTHFGQVMVTADYYMKRLVNGSVALGIPGFTSLTDAIMDRSSQEMEATGHLSGPSTSLNRFWFFPGRNRYGVDGDMLVLLDCPVTLLTEQEYVSEQGIAGYGRPMPEAKEFADSFGAHYDEIAAQRPIYQELEGLFRFVALAKVLQYRREPVDLRYLTDHFPVPKAPVPATLPGVCRVKYYEQQPEADGSQGARLWLPSGGGVKIGTKVRASDFVPLRGAKPFAGGSVPRAPGRQPGAQGQASGPTRRAAGGQEPGEVSGLKSRDTGETGTAPAPSSRAVRTAKPVPAKSRVMAARPSPKALFWDF